MKLAKERYGYAQASNGEVRLRLGFLQDAGLVDRIDWQRFRVTPAGIRFARLLTLQSGIEPGEESIDHDSALRDRPVDKLLADICGDLHRLSRDGSESRAFELAVTRAFSFLGFHAEHLGGSGQTDVLGVAKLAPGDRYRIIIDAKSSSSGTITESAVSFEVLRDHKQKHKADHVVVVGPDFANRLKDWAVDNGVVLLQADDLGELVGRHAATPISLSDLHDIFSRVDTHKDDLFERYQQLGRRAVIVSKILELAFQEAIDEDPIAAGFMSLENITFALRKEFSPRPSTDEVREALSLLSNSYVGALEEGKGGYKLADSPANVVLRLRGLGDICDPRAAERAEPSWHS